ncbi:MAG TPA: hypothetical protein VEW68_01885, partial [Patescibacteria group bacterium]|nr:hypothetical protein [Patescibacteria group bacterium]
MISGALESADPTDVAALQRAVDASDPERRLQRIGMSRIEIGRDALDALPDAVSRIAGAGQVVVLMDHTPMLRAGEDLKQSVVDRLSRRFDVRTCALGVRGGEL